MELRWAPSLRLFCHLTSSLIWQIQISHYSSIHELAFNGCTKSVHQHNTTKCRKEPSANADNAPSEAHHRRWPRAVSPVRNTCSSSSSSAYNTNVYSSQIIPTIGSTAGCFLWFPSVSLTLFNSHLFSFPRLSFPVLSYPSLAYPVLSLPALSIPPPSFSRLPYNVPYRVQCTLLSTMYLIDQDPPWRPLVLLAHRLQETHVLEPFLQPGYYGQACRCLSHVLSDRQRNIGGFIVVGVGVGGGGGVSGGGDRGDGDYCKQKPGLR